MNHLEIINRLIGNGEAIQLGDMSLLLFCTDQTTDGRYELRKEDKILKMGDYRMTSDKVIKISFNPELDKKDYTLSFSLE